MKRALVWFRQDLRLHDNEALQDALESADEVFGVYVFDTRNFKGKTRFGFPKTGEHRARFIIQAVADLRNQLQKLGSDLVVRTGHPENELFDLAKALKTNWVFCNRERTREEVLVQDALEQRLWSIGQEVRYSRGKMLYYTADLPFPVTHAPDAFTQFRKETEPITPVRKPLPDMVQDLPPLPAHLEAGTLPQFSDFHLSETPGTFLPGGESAALERLNHYLWETRSIDHYKESHNIFDGVDASSHFSAYLSQGCLSPKTVYWKVKEYESAFGSSASTEALIHELLWRDYYRLMAKKHGNLIFQQQGIRGHRVSGLRDWELLHQWISGKTGIPVVDANMRYFRQFGFMSDRGRQLVSGFLVHDLKLDWLLGAEYFESQLIDYDPCSNYGNWQQVAGIGPDLREERSFNLYSQAKRYDPRGDFVRDWVPELARLEGATIHLPDQADQEVLRGAGIRLGITYPFPLIETDRWI
ncbi:MAG: DASH family cryptochrome [Saprospiraceae bacterium]|nr:DASH family cryptochrome [Saprospiraceae bacterium]MCB9318728.1 DASH family cryptochrome [Lewinellaceae bacterium]